MKSDSPIRTILVEDERPARNRLRRLLQQEADIEVVAEASNGKQALDQIQTLRPVLLFLDIQMPEMDGFDVLRSIDPQHRPVTIFVTAYDQYALAAFDAHAVDYLLKPYGDTRFQVALARARRFLASEPERLFGRLQALVDYVDQSREEMVRPTPDPLTYLDHIVLKQPKGLTLLPVDEIQWIEAAGVYVKLHTTRETYLHRAPLGQLARQLDPRWFVRVHRSTIVRLEAIATFIPDAHGEYAVILKDKTRLKLTRTYRSALEARLKQVL